MTTVPKISLKQVGLVAAAEHELSQACPNYGKPGFQEAMQRSLSGLLFRHVNGDWGDVNPHDWKVNEEALKTGARILSSYTLFGVKLWIISDAAWGDDPHVREVTTILRPEDY